MQGLFYLYISSMRTDDIREALVIEEQQRNNKDHVASDDDHALK